MGRADHIQTQKNGALRLCVNYRKMLCRHLQRILSTYKDGKRLSWRWSSILDANCKLRILASWSSRRRSRKNGIQLVLRTLPPLQYTLCALVSPSNVLTCYGRHTRNNEMELQLRLPWKFHHRLEITCRTRQEGTSSTRPTIRCWSYAKDQKMLFCRSYGIILARYLPWKPENYSTRFWRSTLLKWITQRDGTSIISWLL